MVLPLFLTNTSPHLTSDGNLGVGIIEKSKRTSKLVIRSLRKSVIWDSEDHPGLQKAFAVKFEQVKFTANLKPPFLS